MGCDWNERNPRVMILYYLGDTPMGTKSESRTGPEPIQDRSQKPGTGLQDQDQPAPDFFFAARFDGKVPEQV